MVKNKDSRMAMGQREWLRELADCDKVITDEETDVFGRIKDKCRVNSEDEADEDLEDECKRLNSILGLPADTYSLTKIKVILPESTNYGIKTGLTHMRMNIFSPFSRGLQGGAIAITAFVTASLMKPRLWTETIIDQIIDDGDTYYCESYKGIKIPDRKTLTVLKLGKSIRLQHTHRASISIDDAVQTGTFRSKKPTEMHLIKALQLFFKNNDACVLISPVLNISIWRDGRSYNLFDGQPRNKNLLPDDAHGSAKLITLQDLIGVLFVILEKSSVSNEHFVLYPIRLMGLQGITDDDLGIRSFGPPKRRPSGYNIQGKFRAVVSSSFHISHPDVPEVLQGRGHLIVALAALIYSRLINAPKWTTPMLDVIINQAHIYLVDLARVLDKKFDAGFNLAVGDVLGDVFLGVYGAKVKVSENVIPGQGKKGKMTIDTGLREFFKDNELGVLEAKKVFYAVWKGEGKYYFFDPFACDVEGFRVDANDPGEVERYRKASACVTMNSSVNELMEIILENTGNTEKDPFFIHGVQVLYVKTHSSFDGPGGTVVYRGKGTNRRPHPAPTIRELDRESDGCLKQSEKIPEPIAKTDDEPVKEVDCQFPEPMTNIEEFMRKEELSENEDEEDVKFYGIVNPHRIIVHGSKNCLSEEFEEAARGRQCLSIAVAVLSFAKVKHPAKWRGNDLDYLIDVGDKAHADLISWIGKGSPPLPGGSGDDDEEEEEEEDEEEKEEDEEEDEDEDEGNLKKGGKVPSHIDISMLPSKMKFGADEVKFSRRMSFAEGDADPLVNLGEALDHYFRKYDEMILENKGLMYPTWKSNGNYFVFNPYGGDEEGWRLRERPGALVVTDSINELIDVFHGLLEFNDRRFFIHFVHIEAVGPGGKYKSPVMIEVPQDDVERYQTAFLPLTDEDVLALKPERKETFDEDEEEEELDEVEEEEEEEEDEEAEEEEGAEVKKEKEEEVEEERQLEDPLKEVDEEDRPDPPKQLNLFLLTTNVKLEDEQVDQNAQEALEYERLKYNHPPPYVVPPKRVLAMLLAAKKATKSVPSLVSCFSVDSKLGIKTDLPPVETGNGPVIEGTGFEHNSKLIKLPPKKYLFSRISPIGFTPLRAINEKFIHDDKENEEMRKKCRNGKVKGSGEERFYFDEVPEEPGGVRIMPSIIPLGPVIQTPVPRERIKPCGEGKKRVCRLSDRDRENSKLERIVCNTEDILFDMIFPMLKFNEKSDEESEKDENDIDIEEKLSQATTDVQEDQEIPTKENLEKIRNIPEKTGFTSIDETFGIISGNDSLKDRETHQDYHLKACYFAAILCILAKIKMAVENFNETLLDQIIFLSKKIYSKTGSLRYKLSRLFRNIEFLGIKFNVILKQTAYADPENFDTDALPKMLDTYFENHSTGILVFGNASYAFWLTNGRYYVFDPYACDEKGQSHETGTSCLLEFYSIEEMLKKMDEHLRIPMNQPYRIHTLCITHMEELKPPKKPSKPRKPCAEETLEESPLEIDEEDLSASLKSEVSLIELSDWVKYVQKIPEFDVKQTTFAAINNFNASALEVPVVENDITRPLLAPFKTRKSSGGYLRRKPFDRKFNEHSILLEPIDLCIMAWSCIRDPREWGTRTIRGIYEASKDLAFDSLLAAEDSTVSGMIDGLLPEFDVANYRFYAVFAPIHVGKLFAVEGWNLAMSLKKVFDTEIYSGAVILCEKSHIGVLRRGERFYAWWGVPGKKNLRIITSDSIEDFLRLIVMEIGETEETEFQMRVMTISYAKKLDPDCDDLRGFHEPGLTSSLPQVYRRDGEPYDIEEMFKPTIPTSSNPVFVLGSVSFDQRDLLKEPHVKRCYFVAVIALMVKRDIIQSPMGSMIDKLLQVADNLYREFDNPKFHTEHILRNVTIMNRIFDFRDVASGLFLITENHVTGQNDFCTLLKSELKKHFKKHNDGVLHFTNCCYGFWYSRGTDSYYYLDPYPCNSKGRRVPSKNGSACLCVFSKMCQMVKHMCANRFENTTGFFIHRLHIESINAAPFLEFQEDPMWVYLDYHWSSHHSSRPPLLPKKKSKKKKAQAICREQLLGVPEKSFWNNYAVEVPQLIYSVWGTLGAYDARFGERVGKNQAAICVAVLAMQNLCHPSKWSSGILDSAVICGDTYYTESMKNAVKRRSKFSNIFNLQPCFKVFPHIWKIEYLPDMCGVLYGGQGKLPLSTISKQALKYSKNLLLKCGRITLGVLSTDNGFYVADPCWTGPPLFLRNHGAIYVLRCKNFTTMIYAIVKMLNSSQRLEFSLTPVVFEFKQEVCRSSDEKKHIVRGKIVMDGSGGKPGLAQGPRVPVCGAVTTGDEDNYDKYRRNVELGLKYGEKLEHPVAPSPMPRLDRENARKIALSTKWRKYRGVPRPRVRHSPSVDPRISKKLNKSSSSEESLARILEACDRYPLTIDFVADKDFGSTMKRLTRKKTLKSETPLTKPLDCLPRREFIMKKSKKEFKKRTREMADESLRIYKHRLRGEDSVEEGEGIEEVGVTEEEDYEENIEEDGGETEETENEG